MCFGEAVSDSQPITERTIETNGVQLHTLEAGEPGAPLVVLAHGFPELAYSWRHQIPALAAAGYHVLAPDQRGYGRTTSPADIADYNVAALSGDLIGLLDDVGADKAVFVGHDWGAPVVWGSAQLHPDRVAAVVGMSVPPVPRSQVRADDGVPRDLRRQLLLHALFPGARGRRRRAGRRPAPDHHADAGRADAVRGSGGRAAHDRTGPGRLHRAPAGDRRPAGLDHARRRSTTTSTSSPAPASPAG